jgi:hypothetical protein
MFSKLFRKRENKLLVDQNGKLDKIVAKKL